MALSHTVRPDLPAYPVVADPRPVSSARDSLPRTVALSALGGLATLTLVMLAALFTQTDPYPPQHFAPLFGTSLALSIMTGGLVRARSRWFLAPLIPVLLISLLSVGPQKLYPGESDFFAQTPAVYPVIVTGTALIVALLLSARALWRAFAQGAAA